jgi:hypothetical protein
MFLLWEQASNSEVRAKKNSFARRGPSPTQGTYCRNYQQAIEEVGIRFGRQKLLLSG